MRRWNGWGDDGIDYHLTHNAKSFIHEKIGMGCSHKDVTISEIVGSVPKSRLRRHPLITIDPEIRIRHARGQSFPDWVALRGGDIGQFPDGVAFPNSKEDVSELIQFAKKFRIRVIPYGGGTSVVGHINILAAHRPVLTINLSRLNRCIRIDEESHLATFGAGIVGSDLEAQLRSRGFTLGHYPQSFEYSTLGGWIATRSSGQQSIGYGRIESLYKGGTLDTPSGSMDIPVFPASAAGPDLKELILGSEGRLGIITTATIQVSPIPEREDFHAIFFPDWNCGFLAVKEIIHAGVPLSLLRYSNAEETKSTLALAGRENLTGLLERLLALRDIKEGKCMLLTGFSGKDSQVKTSRKHVLGISGDHDGVHIGRTFGSQWLKTRFQTPYLRNTLWDMGYGVDTLETAVPWGRVNQTLVGIEKSIKKSAENYEENVHVFSHLSHIYPTGSSIYTTFIFRLDQDLKKTLNIWKDMKDSACRNILENGGTISHHHGVGIDHANYLFEEKREIGMVLIKNIFESMDPNGIMNPGKLLPII